MKVRDIILIAFSTLVYISSVSSQNEVQKDKDTYEVSHLEGHILQSSEEMKTNNHQVLDDEGNKQKYFDETECPRVSKFLDLIKEDQTSLVSITAMEHVENSNILIVGTQSGDIELWDFQSKDILTRFSNNNSGASIKKIIYLTAFDKILVLYDLPLSLLNNTTQQYSLIIWDPQTQKQVFVFPQMENFQSGNKKPNSENLKFVGSYIIDISLQIVVSNQDSSNNKSQNISEMKFTILTSSSIIICSLSSSMTASCQVEALNKAYIQSNPLRIFITSSNKYTIFTERGLIEYDEEKHNYQALLLIKDGAFSQCLYYPVQLKYILMKNEDDTVYIFDQDSQKDQLKKLIEVNVIKNFRQKRQQKQDKSNDILSIVRIENKQPSFLTIFQDGTLLHINYEDDKILEEISIPGAKIISPLKQSPSFFVAQKDGSINFYRQTMYLGTINLQSKNPFSKSNQLRRWINLASYSNGSTQTSADDYQNFVSEVIQNVFRIYHLSFQSAFLLSNDTILFSSDQQIADFSVNYSSKIVYFYEAINEILYICKIGKLDECIKKQLAMNTLNKDESFELKMKKVIHFREGAEFLIVNNLNHLYIFSINYGENINLEDHLTLVYSQKYITRSQSPMMINNIKQRYANSNDSLLLFLSDGNKLSVFEFLKSTKVLNEIYSYRIIKPYQKVVAVEVLQEEQLIILQFINNTFQFYDLKEKKLLSDIIELEQYYNQFINYDYFLELDLRRVIGGNYIISQLNNKRVVIFDFKTKDIHFMSSPLINYVYQFQIDYLQQIFYVGQYSSTENIHYYDLILQRPYLEFRGQRGSIDNAQLFSLSGQYLVLQHTDYSFWTVDLDQNLPRPTQFFKYTLNQTNEKVAYFLREGLFTLISTSGKVYRYPFYNSKITGSPQILESPCPSCKFDQNIRVLNTTIPNMFLIYDSTQLVLYNSIENSIIWYQIHVFSNMSPCQLYVGFENKEIQMWNCENHLNVYLERKVTSNEEIVSFHKSQEEDNKIYVVSPTKIVFYSMKSVENNIIDSIYNYIDSSLHSVDTTPKTVYEFTDCIVIKSTYLKVLGIQVVLTSKNQLLLLGFGQKVTMKLQSLLSDPQSIVFIGSTEDKKKVIISTTQKVWFINISPLFANIDYNTGILDFYKEPKKPLVTNDIKQYSPILSSFDMGKFNNACLLNIYFQASSETRSMSVFGQGSKTDPYSHFSAVQSLLIQIGLSNLIFSYKENQLNLRFFSHEPNLYHKISKKVSLQNSAFTQINFIGEKNPENTVLEIEGGYELNQYMSVTFSNIIFKSVDSLGDSNYGSVYTSPSSSSPSALSSDKGILQFSVSNVNTLSFDSVHFGIFSISSDLPKYIAVTNCTKINLTNSEFYGTSFLIENVQKFTAQQSLIFGTRADLISNEKQKMNLLRKKGIIFLRQVTSSKTLENNKQTLTSINLVNCQINSIKFFAYACNPNSARNLKAPSLSLNSTVLQHSSMIGLDSCRFMQDFIVNIQTISLIDIGYKDSQILTDGMISISRIESIEIKNTALSNKNYGSQGALLVQYPGIDTSIGKLDLKNIYLNDIILFTITKDFQVVNTTITNCMIAFSSLYSISSSNYQMNVQFSQINITNTSISDSSSILDMKSTLASRVDISTISLQNVTTSYSSLISASQEKSQIIMKVDIIFLSRCIFKNSKVFDKGSEVYTNIQRMLVHNNTQFVNSILYKSATNIENQIVNLLNIPMFNTMESLEISNCTFNQSKILEIKDQANFFIKSLNFTRNNFIAQIQDVITEQQTSYLDQQNKYYRGNNNNDNPNNDETTTDIFEDNSSQSNSISDLLPFTPVSEQNRIRYLLEVVNLKIFNANIVNNDFTGYIVSGQPQTQSIQQEISQIYQNLYLCNNTFLPQSNFIFLEINFNQLNRNSSVQITNFTLVNNTVDILNQNIPLSQLEDGRTFYFFGSDKLGIVQFENGQIRENDNIGFVNIKFSLNSIRIDNVNATGKKDSFIKDQPFLQILHPRRFIVTNCNFENINIEGSNFLNVELNRQYFLVENTPEIVTKDESSPEKENKNQTKADVKPTNKHNTTNTTSSSNNKSIKNNGHQILMDGQHPTNINNFQRNGKKVNEHDINRRILLQQSYPERNQDLIFNSNEGEDNFDIFAPFCDEKEDSDEHFEDETDHEDSEQSEEMYFLILLNNKFNNIIGQNISQSITSSVLSIQTGLIINIFIENCEFVGNVVTANESYSRQRRLSQIDIMAINSNIYMNNNDFKYGKFDISFSMTLDTVYFHLLGKYIQFRNYVESYNYFNGECGKLRSSNYMAAGIIEGKLINIEYSVFNGTCTQTQPTMYIKLFDQSQLKIINTKFIDLYAEQQGAGLVINGVTNQVEIKIQGILIDRMHSPSSTCEGFFLFSNLKKGSIVNISNIDAKKLFTQNGSLIKSINNEVAIQLENIKISNEFNMKMYEKYSQYRKQVSLLEGKKAVADYINQQSNKNGNSNKHDYDSEDEDYTFSMLLSSQPQEDDEEDIEQYIKNDDEILLSAGNQQQTKNNLTNGEKNIKEYIHALKLLEIINYLMLTKRVDSISQELQQIDGGQLIQVKNAHLLKIINLDISNYGIVFNQVNELIYIEQCETVFVKGLNIYNNTFNFLGALKVYNSKFIMKDSSFNHNSYKSASLLLFSSLSSSSNILENVKLNDNICSQDTSCYAVLLSQASILNLKDTQIHNNSGNNTVGALYYSLSSLSGLNLENPSLAKIISPLGKGEIVFDQLSIFNNSATQIGAFALEIGKDISCVFNNSDISQNKGQQIGGLSLQIYDSNSLLFLNSTIRNNTSEFTGGLKIQKSTTYQIRDNYTSFIYNNTPNQISSGPRSFSIIPLYELNKTDLDVSNKSQIEKLRNSPAYSDNNRTSRQYKYQKENEKLYVLNDFNSGDNLPDFYMKLFEENNEVVKSSSIPNVRVYLSVEDQNVQGNFLKGIDGYYYSYVGKEFDPNVGLLFKDLQLFGQPGSTIKIVFKLLDIQFENAYSLIPFSNSLSFYSFNINVNIRKCLEGEYIKNNLMTTECEKCSKQYYSLLDPHESQNVKCIKCPDNAQCPGSNNLILNEGYWRDQQSSDAIIECKYSPENCQGGNKVGDESCTNNRIGPLCETCNIKEGYTDLSANQCLNCSQVWQATLIILFILLFFIFYIFISIDSTVSRIKKFGILFEFSSANHIGQTSMLVKQFVSYLQVLSIISYFRFNFGKESISSIIYTIGNPLIGFNNIVSCFVYQFSNTLQIPHVYVSFTMSLLIPITLSLIVLIVQMIFNFRNYYYRKYYLSTMILVNYFYFTPLILARTMELMTCRQIGDEKYISASVIYSCKLDSFKQMNLFYLLPLIFILLFAIPIWIIYRIRYRVVQKLPLKYFQYILGDFRKKYFYWEFVRFFTKIALVSLPILFQDDIRTMGQVLNLILIFYYSSVLYFHPYWTEICQRMELITGAVLFITFHFCLLSYNKDNYSIWWWVSIIVIALANIPLFAWYIISFFQAYKPTLNRFFHQAQRRKMSESDDPQARAHLLWQLALFTVRKQIKKEKALNLRNAKNQKSDQFRSTQDNASFVTRSTLTDQRSEMKKKSKLLWWRRSDRNSNSGQSNDQQQSQITLHKPLLDKGGNSPITQNKYSQHSEDYNPYHDFNFSFLPQDPDTNHQRKNNYN